MDNLVTIITDFLSSPAAKEIYATLISILSFSMNRLEILAEDLIILLGGVG